MCAYFSASLVDGEAVLRFPYDEGLRQLLRAIPGRSWDPVERVWCVPLEPDCAESLARLLASLPGEPEVSEALRRAIERRRGRRIVNECLLDMARADGDWWLSFATDTAPALAQALLEHPDAYSLPVIARGLIPFDDEAVRLVRSVGKHNAGLRFSEAARHALLTRGEHVGRDSGKARKSATAVFGEEPMHDVELCRDRFGERWILLAAEHARLARVLAAQAGLRAREGPAGTLGLPAREEDGHAIAELIEQLEPTSVDRRVNTWLLSATTWQGTVEVDGPPEAPVFLLLGDTTRLPPQVRERAVGVPGGASVPLTLESWRLMDGELGGWLGPAAKRCIAALREGRPAPPAVLELSEIHEEQTFVLAPGHESSRGQAFAALTGVMAPRGARRGSEHEHTLLPALRVDPFCVPELDRFLAEDDIWVAPAALAALQEVREQHARAAGLVELSAATEATLEVPGLGGELKPFQRAGVDYLLSQRRAFLADEQGLGKTIEALATLEADGAYPAVVVCPASLKLNWVRELQLWLPHRSVQALVGTGARAEASGPPSTLLEPAELTIVNYDILAARLPQLRALKPRALVLDESHYCKNAAAKRTQAVAQLASAVPRKGLVLALTGTPVS
jgi:hypothetical protein